jgi:hypothetical protein
LGAFDPVHECARIAHEYGLWVHLDASWGGAMAFSSDLTHRHALLGGSEQCDSITWNPHKLMGIPLLCSAFLVKRASVVGVNSLKAGYLFHEDEEHQDLHEDASQIADQHHYKPWDLGDGTIGCGRRGDSLKLYLTWVLEGSDSFTKRVDHARENAKYLYTLLNSPIPGAQVTGSFMPVLSQAPDFINTCFWYIPSFAHWSLAADYHQTDPQKFPTPLAVAEHLRRHEHSIFHCEMDKITKRMHKQFTIRAKFMVDYAPLIDGADGKSVPVFWRVVMINPALTTNDVRTLLVEIDDVGQSLSF